MTDLRSEAFSALRVRVDGGVAWAAIDNPPVNVVDARLAGDLKRFAEVAREDSSVTVVVWESANPEFFAAHADFNWLFDPASLMALSDPGSDERLNPLQQIHESLRTIPQVTIAKLRGRLRAGGAELAMSADMRFAAEGRTWLSQPEILMGIFPGGGGTQYLTRLVGRARAMEIVLSGELYGTDIAEKYGWINRAVPDEHLDAFVDALARQIAALPTGVAYAAKEALDAAEASGPVPNLVEEAQAHGKVYPSPPEVVERMRVMAGEGGQQRRTELDLERVLRTLPWQQA